MAFLQPGVLHYLMFQRFLSNVGIGVVFRPIMVAGGVDGLRWFAFKSCLYAPCCILYKFGRLSVSTDEGVTQQLLQSVAALKAVRRLWMSKGLPHFIHSDAPGSLLL